MFVDDIVQHSAQIMLLDSSEPLLILQIYL